MADEVKKEDVEETTSKETKPDTPNDDIKPKGNEEERSPEDESADKIADMLRRIEKLETENFAKEKWDLARQLLELEDVKLTCKYIPMASDHKNLLKAEYPAAQIDGQQITFAELLFYLDENGEFNKVTPSIKMVWQECKFNSCGRMPSSGFIRRL